MLLMTMKSDVFCGELLFFCLAAPSFVKLPLFHEFEQFGSNYLSHCDKGVCQSERGSDGHELGFVVPERICVTLCVKHHAKFGSIFPGKEIWLGQFLHFPMYTVHRADRGS